MLHSKNHKYRRNKRILLNGTLDVTEFVMEVKNIQRLERLATIVSRETVSAVSVIFRERQIMCRMTVSLLILSNTVVTIFAGLQNTKKFARLDLKKAY